MDIYAVVTEKIIRLCILLAIEVVVKIPRA
jgi:hypothetical protein